MGQFKRFTSTAIVLASTLSIIVMYQNFTFPDGTRFASNYPMGTLQTDFSKIVDFPTKAEIFRNTSQINHAIYMSFKDQAYYLKYNVGTEYGGGAQYQNTLNMMAESNFFFTTVSNFNNLIPTGLPAQTVFTVYRGTVMRPEGGSTQSTFSLVLAPVVENGVVTYKERILTCAHCFEKILTPGTQILFEGPNNSSPIVNHTLTTSDINSINSQLKSGYFNGDGRDYIMFTPPTAISNHKDVVAARSADLIPRVNGDILNSVSTSTPLYSPGYSSIYNGAGAIESPTRLGVVSLRDYYNDGRVQPNIQVQYKVGSYKGVVQTMADVSGANLIASSGHSGGPIIAMYNGRPYVVAVTASEHMGNNPSGVQRHHHSILPNANGTHAPITSVAEANTNLSQTFTHYTQWQKLKSVNPATSTSCKWFGVCKKFAGPDVERIKSILSNLDTALAAFNDMVRRINLLSDCFFFVSCTAEAYKGVFFPAAGLPSTTTLNGLLPDTSNNLIYRTSWVAMSMSDPQFESSGALPKWTYWYGTAISDQTGARVTNWIQISPEYYMNLLTVYAFPTVGF